MKYILESRIYAHPKRNHSQAKVFEKVKDRYERTRDVMYKNQKG